MSDTDPPMVVQLPLSAWQIVLAHLQLGTYQAVAPSVTSILAQLEAQMAAAAAAQQAKVVVEARNVTEAADAATRHTANEANPTTKAH
jgi:hypothetical protein